MAELSSGKGLPLVEYAAGVKDGSVFPEGIDGMTLDTYKDSLETLASLGARCTECDPRQCAGALVLGNLGITSKGTYLEIACPQDVTEQLELHSGASALMIDMNNDNNSQV